MRTVAKIIKALQGRFKDSLLRASVNRVKRWTASLKVCKLCGDRAVDGLSYCDGCFAEISGKTNGAYILSGKKEYGRKQVRVLPDNETAGVPGRMGIVQGPGAGMCDNIARLLEEADW